MCQIVTNESYDRLSNIYFVLFFFFFFNQHYTTFSIVISSKRGIHAFYNFSTEFNSATSIIIHYIHHIQQLSSGTVICKNTFKVLKIIKKIDLEAYDSHRVNKKQILKIKHLNKLLCTKLLITLPDCKRMKSQV